MENDHPVRFTVNIDREACKGCEWCLAACRESVLCLSRDLNARGSHYVEVCRIEACTGCLRCGRICPDAALEITCETDA